jgi:hypothetical protein
VEGPARNPTLRQPDGGVISGFDLHGPWPEIAESL